MKKFILVAAALLTAFAAIAADKSVRLSISTGGTAGVYYPLGGGMAAVLSKYVPEIEATAEVTGGSVDNIKLIGAGKSDIGFSMADSAWDGYKGQDKFKDKVPLRTLMVLYPNPLQIATVEGTGIEKITDLKGKRVSTGSAGSGTEIMSLRLLRACGLDPDKDLTRDRLSLAESVNALKDKKIDALFWSGGLPTAGLTDLAATPNVKIKLIDHGDAADAMRKAYGPLYIADIIPAKTYPGQEKDATNVTVWNVLVASEKMSDKVAYDVVKTLFEKKPELVAVHKDARYIDLKYQSSGSPIP
ncbi:MAG: TAXI family TRAP transporter solute-binding subunit, partial [Burkholderiales bacterium]